MTRENCLWSGAAYGTAGDGAHWAQLEKLLVLAFDIITVALTERETGSQWGSVRVTQLVGGVCVFLHKADRHRGSHGCSDASSVLRRCTLGKNILSLSIEGLLYGGLPVALRECEKHFSVCCGLTPSSHPIMDLGCGPSAVLSKHYFW